mgnify:CR=1 FL=1
MNRICLKQGYILTYSSVEDWSIIRSDGSAINKNNLPKYVEALVDYIIENRM